MIIVRIWEGLGNQLFQYAYARALQLRTGQKVYLDTERIYKESLEKKGIERECGLDNFKIELSEASEKKKLFFFLKQDNLIKKILFMLSEHNLGVPGFYLEKELQFKNELKTIRGVKYLMGWFQNEKYFAEYREVLLKEITPKKKIKISSVLRKILNSYNTVSVHVRRGDYKKINNVLPVSYYETALKQIEGKICSPFYIVFSDDIEWVKNNLKFGENVMYMSNGRYKDYEELLLMSRCKHNIIANSTFSWWGAWLNRNPDKIVIAPRQWMSNQRIIVPDNWSII